MNENAQAEYHICAYPIRHCFHHNPITTMRRCHIPLPLLFIIQIRRKDPANDLVDLPPIYDNTALLKKLESGAYSISLY